MNLQPRILIIGGPDVHLRIELIRLLRAQYHIQIAGSSPDITALFEREGLKYHYYPMGQTVNPFSYFASLSAIFSIIRSERPHIVHTFDTKPSILGRLAAVLNRVPVVVATITGLGSLYIIQKAWYPRLIRPVYEFLQRILGGISDLTFFYTQDDASFFVSRGLVNRKKAFVIPGSGVLLDRFSRQRFSNAESNETRSEIGLPNESAVVTMIARLVRSKGVLLFAEIARRVKVRVPQAHFLLIGPQDQDSLDSLSAEELSEVCEAVQWIGPRQKIENYLAISDIFVLPSEREGIPRVLVEAASMGLPLVASDLPGCRDVIVHGENGFLIFPRDLDRFEQAIVDLLTHPGTRHQFGAASRELVMQKFDLKKIADTLANTYAELLERKGLLNELGK